jgi:hypothetical protein
MASTEWLISMRVKSVRKSCTGRPARSSAIVSRATRSCCPGSEGKVIRQFVGCTSAHSRPRSPALTAASSAPVKAWSDG